MRAALHSLTQIPRRVGRGTRRIIHAIGRPFRRSRGLSITLGCIVGVGAIVLAWLYANPSFEEVLLLPLALGGTTYYVAHYGATADVSDVPFWRGYLWAFSMSLLVFAYTPQDAPIEDFVVSMTTVLSVVLLTMTTVAVSARSEPSSGADADEGSWDRQAPAASTNASVDAD